MLLQVPAHLATSPIDLDISSVMEQGIKKMKQESDSQLAQDATTVAVESETENKIETSPSDQFEGYETDKGLESCHSSEVTLQSKESNPDILNIDNECHVKQSGSQTEGLYNTLLHAPDLDTQKVKTPITEVPLSGLRKENSSNSSELSQLTDSYSSKLTTSGDIMRDSSQASLYFSSADLESPIKETSPSKDFKLCNSNAQGTAKVKVDIAVQTDMTGPEIELKAIASDRVRTTSETMKSPSRNPDSCVSAPSVKAEKAANAGKANKDEPTRDRRVSGNSHMDGGQSSLSSTPTKTVTSTVKARMYHRDSEASTHSTYSQASTETYNVKATESSHKKCQKRRRKKSRPSESKESSSNDSSSIPDGAMFDIELEDELDNAGLISMTGNLVVLMLIFFFCFPCNIFRNFFFDKLQVVRPL